MRRLHRAFPRLAPLVVLVGTSIPEVSWADDAPTTAERLEASLLRMGYIDIEINGCDIAFSRVFGKTCPTDQALSYRRIIGLNSIDLGMATPVTRQPEETRVVYEFTAPLTKEYAGLKHAVSDFDIMQRVDYPSSSYPFRFDGLTPLLAHYFYEAIPKDTAANWWMSQTCFGEAPYVYPTFRMDYDDEAELSEFREALLDHDTQNGCMPD